jgi:DNA (cytosine-5)-methyltransferase 1
MKYLSVCSGIEAATCAWHDLGWNPVGFSEIEKFPSAVLAHHYPAVPNLGDLTKFKDWPDDLNPDILVGGTPCQSFSVAGLRKGLADPRGNLALVYLALADKYRPEWLVWENVPGVLSSGGGRDFGSFLGALVELGYGFAYRVLDAQYCGLAQRRRRVFVVANSRDWRRAAAVLFERQSLSGHPAPRRETGQRPAPTISARPTGGGGLGTDFDLDGGLIASTGDISHCLNAGGMGRQDYETETLISHSLLGEGFDASEDGTGRGTPLIACEVAETLTVGANQTWGRPGGEPIAFPWQVGGTLGLSGTLVKNQTMAVAIALRGRDGGATAEMGDDCGHALRASQGGGDKPHVLTGMAVRRLTPRECERLQGFPDDYTNIPWRGKPESPDGPRYKALGNSFAVPVVRWIGRRIAAVAAQCVMETAA